MTNSPIRNPARKSATAATPAPTPDLGAKEAVILASVISNGADDLTPNVKALFDNAPESFTDARHGATALVIKKLISGGESVNAASVICGLGDAFKDVRSFLKLLLDDAMPLAFAEGEAGTLLNVFQLRKAVHVCYETQAAITAAPGQLGDILARACASLASITAPEGTTRLTVRTPAEILEMTFDPSDCIWGDWLVACGEKTATVGSGGIGKSRLWVQAAICQILGRPFLCFETHGPAKRWLFLQTENSNRRLQTDLAHFEKWVGPADWKKVCEHLFIHTLENDADTMLSLDNNSAVERLEYAIKDTVPDFVVWDVLRDFGIGDLNKDQDMGDTLQTIARLTRKGDIQRKRIPVVLHHAGTGKAGAAKAVGYDRSSHGRNSKVLFGWARSMINIAPGSPDENPPLVISCGKNNNGAMFPAFAARFNPETHIYELHPDFDLEAWTADVSGKKATDDPLMTAERVGQLCKTLMSKAELAKAIVSDCGVQRPNAYRYIRAAEKANRIKFNPKNETYSPQ